MFATPASLRKRTGKTDANRPTYLRQLIDEYHRISDESKREQILANLANFAYDPINYEYFRRFGIMDIFLSCLNEELTAYKRNSYSSSSSSSINKKLEFSIGALCNLCLDKKNQSYLHSKQMNRLLVDLIMTLFKADASNWTQIETTLNALTMLTFMLNESNRNELLTDDLIAHLNSICRSSNANKRLKTIATLILTDYCGCVGSLKST